MRNHVLSALLCSISFCSAGSVQQKEEPTPLIICASFEQFMESFVGLFKKDTVVEGLEEIEEMTTNLLQTALSIMGGNVEPQLYKERTKQVTFRDTQLRDKLAASLVEHARSMGVTRKGSLPQQGQQDDEEENQAKILTIFAGIVKNFFNIAQDPENRDNVIPNLMGMATGIVEIGSEVIRRGHLSIDANIQEISSYVAHLDNALKEDMLSIVLQKTEELQK